MSSPVRKTCLVESSKLSRYLGVAVTLVTETFQHTGSFKFRGAYEVATRSDRDLIITASSGNFGQALAYACALVGKKAIVVMPAGASRAKVDAVRAYGGTVDLVDVLQKSRADRVRELAQVYPEAYVTSAYDDPFVIEGNASLGRELAEHADRWETIIAPIGGGGLSSGILLGLRESGAPTPVFAAEPLLANDAAESFRTGNLVRNATEPPTLADGARTLCIGERNWAILREGLAGVIEVSEEHIREAVSLLFHQANLKAEPTGALSLAAVLTDPERFQKGVCCIVSGGNVDSQLYATLI